MNTVTLLLLAGTLILNQACMAHDINDNQDLQDNSNMRKYWLLNPVGNANANTNHGTGNTNNNNGNGNHTTGTNLVTASQNFVALSQNYITKATHKEFNPSQILNAPAGVTRVTSQILNAPVGPTGVTTLTMESDLHVTSTVEFIGDTAINGGGNILYLDAGGSLKIDAHSTLTIKNVTIKGIGGQNIFCVDDTGSVIVQNVRWIQKQDFTFAHGSLDIANDFHCIGNGLNFIYTTQQPCTINTGSEMLLDYNFTFKYIPGFNNLFTFADSSSTLSLAGGTFYVGPEGLALLKGLVFVDGQSTFNSEGEITVGDQTANNDTIFVFGGAAILNIANGALTYRNVLDSSWNMRDANAILKMEPNTTLYLVKTLNLDVGTLQISSTANLITDPGASIIGNVSFF